MGRGGDPLDAHQVADDQMSHRQHKGGRSLSPWPPSDRSDLIHLKVPKRLRSQVQQYAINLAWDLTKLPLDPLGTPVFSAEENGELVHIID